MEGKKDMYIVALFFSFIGLSGRAPTFCDWGSKNCIDMDTCSMHVHPTCLKMYKEITKMNQSISCALHAKLSISCALHAKLSISCALHAKLSISCALHAKLSISCALHAKLSISCALHAKLSISCALHAKL